MLSAIRYPPTTYGLLAGTVRCPLMRGYLQIALRLSVSSSSRKSLQKEPVPLGKPAGGISDVLYYLFGSTPEDSYRLLVCACRYMYVRGMTAENPAYVQAPKIRLAQRITGLITRLIPIRYARGSPRFSE